LHHSRETATVFNEGENFTFQFSIKNNLDENNYDCYSKKRKAMRDESILKNSRREFLQTTT